MRPPPITRKHLEKAGAGVLFSPRDLAPLGFSYERLQGLVQAEVVEKIGRGLYRLSEAEPTEHETIAMVCKRIPKGVVCLLTALQVHGIGTQTPRQVWIALDRKARKPRLHGLPVRVVRFSGRMLQYGVWTRHMLGVPVRITSPARTVVDCFRYRNKIGLDVALKALRDGVRSRIATVDEIVRAADVCRVRTVIQPYLESLAA
jgi:predicted transcriptional regulator of viral defense system